MEISEAAAVWNVRSQAVLLGPSAVVLGTVSVFGRLFEHGMAPRKESRRRGNYPEHCRLNSAAGRTLSVMMRLGEDCAMVTIDQLVGWQACIV